MIYFASIYAVIALTCLFAVRHHPDRSGIIVALFPGPNVLFFFEALHIIYKRTKQSGGRCFTGHSYTHVSDSSARSSSIKVACGGVDHYKCINCGDKEMTKWSAF